MPTKQLSLEEWKEKAYDAGWEDGFGGKPEFTSVPDRWKKSHHFPYQTNYDEGYEHGLAQRGKERDNGNK